MRIGFFGGSFDPPHRGHLAVAQAAAERCRLARVMLAPTANQPLKLEGLHAPYADRLEMVRLLCGDDLRLAASGADAPRQDGGPNYTLDTLRSLQSGMQAHDSLVVIVGVDTFLQIKRWHAPGELLRDFDWAVISRPGSSLADIHAIGLTSTQLTRVQVLEGIAEPTSASAVRQALLSGSDVEAMLTPPVLAYIRAHRLYASN